MTTALGLTPIHSALVFLVNAVEAARETTRSQEREIDRRMLDAALSSATRVLAEDDAKRRAKADADRAAVDLEF
jgi:hypothetical protein